MFVCHVVYCLPVLGTGMFVMLCVVYCLPVGQACWMSCVIRSHRSRSFTMNRFSNRSGSTHKGSVT